MLMLCMKATQMVERTTRTRRVVMREEAFWEGGRMKEEGGSGGGPVLLPLGSGKVLFILKILSS